ncbi:single-stranded DNA-specific exonuclease [Cenarchaeum symbiosum A]|uniref:Single-stranded DNA-specific exonuclease n=1 Tax=Cenarchaeum symbiosum (strain A) TaxID=414004 RepID=A0RTT0_CENSY|nr:single-stranded DNA-specific exonuclease [Cenarchaeum symbiosum A]
MVTTHMDCDGIASGGIMAKALSRAGAKYSVSAVGGLGPEEAKMLGGSAHDLHVIMDLGSGVSAELDELKGGWFVLDHHPVSDDENPRVVNAWKFGIDGGSEASAGTMAYLAACAIGEDNTDLAPCALVSALGDRQDSGEKRSFTGKNQEIALAAKERGLVEIDLDLLLAGRETRPLPDALAFTTQPFIEGLTWNRPACLSLLESTGIKLKEGGRWRVPSELVEDEKRKLISAVTKFATGSDDGELGGSLIGHTYTFPEEDRMGLLRDAREYSTMLNSCGRIGMAGAGMAVCMGDRNIMLEECEGILERYRTMTKEYMAILSSERWRISDGKECIMVNGEGVVPESMTGTISSIIAGSPRSSGKIVILRAEGGSGTVKFSSRKSFSCTSGVNLRDLMMGAERFEGAGGGHAAAAGARITKDKLDVFLDYLEANVSNVQGQGNPA